MKKWLLAFILLLFVGGMTACASEEATAVKAQTVTITVPRGLLAGQTNQEIEKNAQDEDISVHINDDDTITYKMTEEKQQELLLGYKTHFEEVLQKDMDDGKLPGVVDVTYSDDMKTFDVSVNASAYQAEGGRLDMDLFYSTGTGYQLFSGIDEKSIDVQVNIIDQDSGQTIDTMSMRESFVNEQSPGDGAD
ncbi:MAG: hypothetical protein Q4C56_03540 [Peptococcaceae bacterium]|nr:hypothetical protein [Peptococcaceae bacterium]